MNIDAAKMNPARFYALSIGATMNENSFYARNSCKKKRLQEKVRQQKYEQQFWLQAITVKLKRSHPRTGRKWS